MRKIVVMLSWEVALLALLLQPVFALLLKHRDSLAVATSRGVVLVCCWGKLCSCCFGPGRVLVLLFGREGFVNFAVGNGRSLTCLLAGTSAAKHDSKKACPIAHRAKDEVIAGAIASIPRRDGSRVQGFGFRVRT